METLSLNWENCFGIKKLVQDFCFEKSHIQLLYAPNGSMKSSFAKTMKYIELGNKEDKPEDRIHPEYVTKYETKIDGTDISKDIVYVINGDEEIDSSKSFVNFLASKELKDKYDNIYNKLTKEKEALMSKLKSVSKSTDCEKEILETFKQNNSENIFSVLEKLALEMEKPYVFYGFRYNDVFDKKGAVKAFVEKYKDKLQDYITKYKDLLTQSDFYRSANGHSFGTYQASQLYQSVEDDSFFAVNHKIILQNDEEIKSKEDLQNKITREQEKILSDKELKKAFEAITKAVDKNVDLRGFKSVLEMHQDWIPEIINYEEFRKKVWFGFLSNNDVKSVFDTYMKVYEENKAELYRIISEAGKQKDKWKEIIELYKARFHVPFSVSIENQEDIILKQESAKLNFSYTDESGNLIKTDKDKLDKILSRGEKRAFIILQFIFDMESRKSTSQETLLVMDDIADSFDYQNKYAIIEYIKDLSQTSNFYSIILTHNYDFYRTLSSRLNVKRDNLWLVEKLTSHEIKFNKGQYTGNVFVNAFIGHDEDDKIFISMIPFVRNLIEYTEGSGSIKYSKLTSCLHIKSDTKTITIQDVANIIEQYTQNKGINHDKNNDSFYDLIMNTADAITREANVDSVKIENKIVLSIAIRLLAEQYMHDAMINAGKIEHDFETDKNQTGNWTKKFKEFCPNDKNKSTIEEVNIMTPEVIHLNSFMYEPLIDMSIHHLLSLYDKCKKMNTI